MSNRGKGEEPGLDEPGPIHFGAGEGPSDEPGPIRFGGAKPSAPKITTSPPASDSEFDFENGPTIALPSYITRAAQSWDPDSPARAKSRREPEPEPAPDPSPPPPAFTAPVETPLAPAKVEPPPPAPEPLPPRIETPPPEDEPPRVYQPPPRRRTVPRPEATYGVFRGTPGAESQPQPVAEEPKRYFTPLPERGQLPVVATTPKLPVLPPEPEPLVVETQKPLIQIQINGMPTLFKGNGLMRGLFFGCLVGVAVGGIAAVLLDLLSPHPAPPPPPLYKVLNAEVQDAPVQLPPAETSAKSQRKGVKGYPRTVTNTVVEPPPSIRVQSAPAPRAVIRSGGAPISADPNAGR
jgi:hypothetical protein